MPRRAQPLPPTPAPPTADELTLWCRHHRLNAKEFAASLGTNPATVRRWLHGTHPAPAYLRYALVGLSLALQYARQPRAQAPDQPDKTSLPSDNGH